MQTRTRTTPPRPSRRRALAVCAAALLASTACTAQTDAAVTQVRAGSLTEPADLAPADLEPADLDPAAEDTVLTVTWGGQSLGLSMDQLEAMRTVSVELHEPFLDVDVTFEGVPLADLLAVTGMPDDVTVLHAVALNEYAVDIPVDVADHPGAVLATRADGEPIPVDAGGPTRLVLADGHPDVRDESLWIWSIDSIADGTDQGR